MPSRHLVDQVLGSIFVGELRGGRYSAGLEPPWAYRLGWLGSGGGGGCCRGRGFPMVEVGDAWSPRHTAAITKTRRLPGCGHQQETPRTPSLDARRDAPRIRDRSRHGRDATRRRCCDGEDRVVVRRTPEPGARANPTRRLAPCRGHAGSPSESHRRLQRQRTSQLQSRPHPGGWPESRTACGSRRSGRTRDKSSKLTPARRSHRPKAVSGGDRPGWSGGAGRSGEREGRDARRR